MRWVGAAMSRALKELDSPWMYSFPGIPSYTWVLIGVTPINYLHLPHPQFAVRKAGAQLKALSGAALNSEGFGSRADSPGCCRPWGALRGAGLPPEPCEPQNCL